MAHNVEKEIDGVIRTVTEMDHTAQEIDDAVEVTKFHSNPNLLDNWYFADPINQRGQDTYGHEPQYCIDRWRINNDYAFVDVNDGYITLRGNDVNGYGGIIQKLEDSLKSDLNGKTITFSVLMKPYTSIKLAGTQVCCESKSTFDIYSVTFNATLNDYVLLNAMYPVTPGAPIADIISVKLEPGSHQTLARQDENGNWVLIDPPPNKALELAKCQRYFRVIDEIIGYNPGNSEYVTIFVNYPDMRISPVATVKGRITNGADQTVGVSYVSSLFSKNSGDHIRINQAWQGEIKFYKVWLDAGL